MRRTFLALLTFSLLAALAEPSAGCPACNIHNYLAPSILSSKTVFVGTVMRPLTGGRAEALVLRPLHGEIREGQCVAQPMFGPERYLGETFVFSDPRGMGPTFEALPTDFEEEVRFLLEHRDRYDFNARIGRGDGDGEDDNPIKDLESALKWVQAVSADVSWDARRYLDAHHAECAGSIAGAIEELSASVFADRDVAFGDYRLEKLLEALYARTSEVGALRAIGWIAGFGLDPGAPPDWENPWGMVGPEGEFLMNLLKNLKRQGELRTRAVELLRFRLPSLAGRVFAGATFALVAGADVPPRELLPSLKDQEARDLFAAGLFWAGRERALMTIDRTFLPEWELALELAERPALRKLIEDRRPKREP